MNNLKELILQNFDPKIGSMLYVSGEVVSFNLDKELISENYVVKRIINYTAIPNENLDNDFLIDQLRNHCLNFHWVLQYNL